MKTYIILITLFFFSVSNNVFGQESEKQFQKHKAFNGIVFEYATLLPKSYNPNKAYKTVISFAGFKPENNKTVVSSLGSLWRNYKEYNTIIIAMKAPIGHAHWVSHSIHHGFNDFLEMIKQIYNVKNQKFHFLGYNEGCIPAQTYISMLSYPPASLVLLSSDYWDHYKDKEYGQLAKLGIPIKLYYKKSDKKGIKKGVNVLEKLKKKKVDVTLHYVDDYNNGLDFLYKR